MKTLLKTLSVLLTIFVIGTATTPALYAQSDEAPETNRESTGGAQTLEDILRRQSGEEVAPDQGETGSADNPEGQPGDLSTRGGASDSSIWRAVRQGEGSTFTSSSRDPNSATLVQDDGEKWLAARNGPLLKYAGYAFGGILLLLVLFRLIRGRIMISGGRSGMRVRRFGFIERFAHWMLAISFIILAVTGFGLLAGRDVIIPALDYLNVKFTHGAATPDPNYGKNTFASLIGAGKWAHNNLSWAFMISLVMIFVLWVFRNIPTFLVRDPVRRIPLRIRRDAAVALRVHDVFADIRKAEPSRRACWLRAEPRHRDDATSRTAVRPIVAHDHRDHSHDDHYCAHLYRLRRYAGRVLSDGFG